MQTNTLEYDYSIAKLFVFSAMALWDYSLG